MEHARRNLEGQSLDVGKVWLAIPPRLQEVEAPPKPAAGEAGGRSGSAREWIAQKPST